MKKRRKNFFPTLVLIVVLWLAWGFLVIQVDPDLIKDILVNGLYLPFFLLFFPASFFTLAVLFDSSRRGLVASVTLTGFLILRLYQLGNGLNLLLLLGIAVVIDRYFEV